MTLPDALSFLFTPFPVASLHCGVTMNLYLQVVLKLATLLLVAPNDLVTDLRLFTHTFL